MFKKPLFQTVWTQIRLLCSVSTLFVSILNSSVMLGNYLQQTISADDIFRCIFLGALRVNTQHRINNNRTGSSQSHCFILKISRQSRHLKLSLAPSPAYVLSYTIWMALDQTAPKLKLITFASMLK